MEGVSEERFITCGEAKDKEQRMNGKKKNGGRSFLSFAL
jgi:hypothetical protein